MKAVAQCNIGAWRMVNQDFVYATDEPLGMLPNLFIVADGMGGHAAGEKASSETVQCAVSLAREVPAMDLGQFLVDMAQAANEHVYAMAQGNPDWKGMGTTLVAATVDEEMVYCVNVGDSRMYILGQDRSLRRVTVDHSLVEMMVRRGELTEEEARLHPKRNLITRAIGTEPIVEVDLFAVVRREAKMLLLCSDGLSSQIPDMRLEEIINMQTVPLKERGEMLINEANRNGGSDNISLILVDLEGGGI